MGLLGSLLGGRRHAGADEGWQPDGTGMATYDGADMDDQGCAGDYAYGASFTLASAPAASITMYVYPVYGPPDTPDTFVIGYRCDYEIEGGAEGGPWSYTAYDEDGEFYSDLDECDAACEDWARSLATTPRTGPSEDDLQLFDWDGALQ
jgi:hypothetical protein